MRFCFQLAAGAIVVVGSASSALQAGNVASLRSVSSVAVPVGRVDPRSGLHVKTIVVAPGHATKPQGAGGDRAHERTADSSVKMLVEEAAQKYDVNAALIDSVIQVESNYNPYAVSPKGAQGLMQLMPETARRFGVRNSFDPRENIHGGVRYLRFLQDTFKDDRLAVAAYNAGEGAVSKYNDVPPYTETVNYVAKVGKRYGKAKKASEAKAKPPVAEAKADEPAGPRYLPVRQFVDADGRIHLTTD